MLRAFLGFSFLMAGLDKLSDPTYLNPSSASYIGKQISQFAVGTPLEGFLLNFAVPNAGLFGVMVMGGELCIGIGVLLGLFTRFSAIMGLMINLTFYLSVTWTIHPFYLGSDLPYAVGWVTLAILGSDPYALDPILKRWLEERPVPQATRYGTPIPNSFLDTPVGRRTFVMGSAAGLVGVMLAAVGVGWGIAHPGRGTTTQTPGQQPAGGGAAPATTDTPASTTAPPPTAEAQGGGTTGSAPTEAPQPPTPTTAANSGQLIAAAGAVPVGQAYEFSLPSGDPAVLVHNDSGYSAYVAICTHQGCQVGYYAPEKLLACPCHGALFDPAQNAEPVRGPARRPLDPVAINVAPDGSVYLQS